MDQESESEEERRQGRNVKSLEVAYTEREKLPKKKRSEEASRLLG